MNVTPTILSYHHYLLFYFTLFYILFCIFIAYSGEALKEKEDSPVNSTIKKEI